jgi:hypothetical protein
MDQMEMSQWLRRIESEYREMPGLELTDRQMQRLWSLDVATCGRFVAALVKSRVLCETPRHTYVLAEASRTSRL